MNEVQATTNAEQFAILGEAISRMAFAARHGLMYNDDRDIYKVGGYPRTLDYRAYRSLYERDGIARRIVDMPAETTWRFPPEIVEPGSEEGTQFTEAFNGLADRLGLWRRFGRADRLSRIGRYSVVLIGAAGVDDQALRTPLGRIDGPENVLYLATYSERHARIDTWVNDPRDERYGLPETYRIDLSSGVADFRGTRSGESQIVHHTRVLHIAEGLLEDDVFGSPALKAIYNDLHDLQKVSTSTGEAFWQRVAGIIQATIDKDMTGVDEGFYNRLDEHLKELYHNLRRTFYGQGVELSRLSESEPNPEAAADLYMTKIAAGAGIPKRMLFGSETGERASTEDQKTYLGMIAERQQQHAEPAILRPFIDRLIEFGALPKPGADGYEVVWPTLFQVPESEIAEANLKRANAAKALTAVGGNPAELVEIDEERNVWLRPSGEREPVDLDEMQERAEEERQRQADEAADRLREMGNEPQAEAA